MRSRGSLGGLIWMVIGIIVAVQHQYGVGLLSDFSHAVSFVVAVFLWPLLLFGANLHVSLGF